MAPPTVLRSAGAMGIATLISRVMGLVREQVFAILFGAGNATDAFNIAFRIPNLLRDLFAEGAMSTALVPTFTRVRAEEGDRRAWRLAGLVFRVLFVTAGLLALLGIFFAPQLVNLYSPAFHEVAGKFELTVAMTRTMFPFFPLVALAAAYMGILNACGKFFLPAFSSALFNLVSVITGASLSFVLPRFGMHPIQGMAIGVVLGGTVQAFCQLPALYRAGYQWCVRTSEDPIWYRDAGLRRMLFLMVPGTIGLAATQVNILINSILATSQGPGAVSWLNYAFRLMQFPIGILGVSIASASLPMISRLWVSKDLDGVRGTLVKSLQHVFALNLPASAGLAFLGYPIIQLIFEYGRFGAQDTHATAVALAAYSVGLTAYSAVKVLVPACYAMGNTRVPVLSSVFSVFMTIVLNLIMIGPFGYVGLALGTSFAAILNAGLLLFAVRVLMTRGGGDFPLASILLSFAKNLAIALLMGTVCWLSYRGLRFWVSDAILLDVLGLPGVVLVRGIQVFGLILEGMLLVVLFARIFRLREITDLFDFFIKNIKKKLSRPEK